MLGRITALGSLLIIAGVYLVLAPIATTNPMSTSVPSATWVEVSVPSTSSLLGGPVELSLAWGVSNVCRGGPVCTNPSPQSYLIIFDCGTATCLPGVNYTLVGSTDAVYQGTTLFSVTPGHHYEVWACLVHFPGTKWNGSVPVSSHLEGPTLGGLLGWSSIGGGAVAVAYSIRPFRIPGDSGPARS